MKLLPIAEELDLALEESAERLGIEPEAIISNMFFLTLGKLEQMAAQKGLSKRARNIAKTVAKCYSQFICLKHSS